jgi:hypothetical protein
MADITFIIDGDGNEAAVNEHHIGFFEILMANI